MVLPNTNIPFVGKNQRGRKLKTPCTRGRQRRGQCSPGKKTAFVDTKESDRSWHDSNAINAGRKRIKRQARGRTNRGRGRGRLAARRGGVGRGRGGRQGRWGHFRARFPQNIVDTHTPQSGLSHFQNAARSVLPAEVNEIFHSAQHALHQVNQHAHTGSPTGYGDRNVLRQENQQAGVPKKVAAQHLQHQVNQHAHSGVSTDVGDQVVLPQVGHGVQTGVSTGVGVQVVLPQVGHGVKTGVSTGVGDQLVLPQVGHGVQTGVSAGVGGQLVLPQVGHGVHSGVSTGIGDQLVLPQVGQDVHTGIGALPDEQLLDNQALDGRPRKNKKGRKWKKKKQLSQDVHTDVSTGVGDQLVLPQVGQDVHAGIGALPDEQLIDNQPLDGRPRKNKKARKLKKQQKRKKAKKPKEIKKLVPVDLTGLKGPTQTTTPRQTTTISLSANAVKIAGLGILDLGTSYEGIPGFDLIDWNAPQGTGI